MAYEKCNKAKKIVSEPCVYCIVLKKFIVVPSKRSLTSNQQNELSMWVFSGIVGVIFTCLTKRSEFFGLVYVKLKTLQMCTLYNVRRKAAASVTVVVETFGSLRQVGDNIDVGG